VVEIENEGRKVYHNCGSKISLWQTDVVSIPSILCWGHWMCGWMQKCYGSVVYWIPPQYCRPSCPQTYTTDLL